MSAGKQAEKKQNTEITDDIIYTLSYLYGHSISIWTQFWS